MKSLNNAVRNIGIYFKQTDSIETTDGAVEEETGTDRGRGRRIDRRREVRRRNLMEKEAERGIRISIEGRKGNEIDTETERRMETILEEGRGNEIDTETDIETEIDKEAGKVNETDTAAE